MLDAETQLRICLLGGFRAERVDLRRSVCDWQRRSAKTLTKLLAVCPGHALHREQVMEILWPGLDLESALNGLGKALHAARRALEPERLPRHGSRYLQLTDCMLSLNAERVVVDADCFERLAADALRRRTIEAYESALAANRGPLLPEDRYEDWCGERRDFLSELRTRLVFGLAEVLEAGGAHDQAADRLREALEEDGTREEAHRRLMRAYAQMGARDRALRQFHICETALRRELGLAPHQETVDLYRKLLHERAAPPGEDRIESVGRELLDPGGQRSSQPFIGRGEVLQSLLEHLARARTEQAGLILLSGESGVGKTRLLAELASEAGRQGATVLCGGSGAHASHPTSCSVEIALEAYAAACSEAERARLASRYPALTRYLPSLPLDIDAPRPGHDSLDLQATVARLLTDLASTRPVLMILGDLAVDQRPSLDLLRYLTRLAGTRRWLFVAAVRDEDAERGTALRRMVESLSREGLCSTIELRCLSRPDCDELIRSLLPSGVVDRDLLDQIYSQSRGNPLFVEELIHAARESGQLVQSDNCWRKVPSASERVPRGIRALVAARLEPADETVRRVLALAAATSESQISLSQLRDGAAALELSYARLLDALDHALEMGVLEEREDGYAFRHPLVRSAFYEGLSRHRREQLRTALDRARSRRPRQLRVAAAG